MRQVDVRGQVQGGWCSAGKTVVNQGLEATSGVRGSTFDSLNLAST